ncbi:MAG TPA: cache domain-containing protein, partial [Verrucomicrobiae bacterium]|nr:cache domain-containing protein [Verrucomicrobiae bacterium]
MGIFSIKSRISFQVKVLVPVVTVMVLLMAVTIWLVNRRVSEQLHEQAAEQLDTAGKIFEMMQANRANALVSKYRNLINEPRFRAVTERTDFETVKQALTDATHEVIKDDDDVTLCTFTFLTNKGQPIVETRDEKISAADFNAQSSAAIRKSAKGEPTVDSIRVGANLFDVVSIPVGSGDKTMGV